MGCDIHIVLERFNEDLDEWVGMRDYKGVSKSLTDLDPAAKQAGSDYVSSHIWFKLRSRDYSFFNALCGVRGEGSDFGFRPKGLPDDASSLSRFVLSEDDPDLHSHSWLDMKDLSGPLACEKGDAAQLASYVTERMGNGGFNLQLLQNYVDDDIEADTINQWRLVFAFDN